MKNKILQPGLLFFLLLASPVLSADLIKIEFEQEPLFSNANLSPGQTVQRWIKVENISDKTQKIAIKAINFCVCGQEELCLNNVLFLKIKQNQEQLFYDSLTNFFNSNEIFLSDLENKKDTQYDIIIHFDEQADNEYQKLTTCFDLIIGATEQTEPISNSNQGSSNSYYKPSKPNSKESTDNPKPESKKSDIQNDSKPEPKQESNLIQFPDIPISQKSRVLEAKKINSIIAGAQTTTATEITTPTSTVQIEPTKKQFSNLFYLRILVFIILIFLIQILCFTK